MSTGSGIQGGTEGAGSGAPLRMAAVADAYDRDLEADLARMAATIETAREAGIRLLAFPEGALGGYLLSLDGTATLIPAGHAVVSYEWTVGGVASGVTVGSLKAPATWALKSVTCAAKTTKKNPADKDVDNATTGKVLEMLEPAQVASYQEAKKLAAAK